MVIRTSITFKTNAEMELVKYEEEFKKLENLELIKRTETFDVKTGLGNFSLYYRRKEQDNKRKI